ncbi:alpha/beta hydrolase fold domain-containing protein [Chitinophaga sp. XS-30]|uniref:alpha/beta hydrolase fold domain-containing protein n=1 Tax=Chitinophaga sp. XS-30 TaxID=2604421 RepID=UPI00143DF88A|nr:alpha/beta hydrolase [Chitinophaga sp. XS-30]
MFTLQPARATGSRTHILYLHGGAYVQSFTLPHWYFLSGLLKGTGAGITAPDYPLAPQHTYREAFAMVESLYKQLISVHDPSSLVLMGDSAGGGFALALAQKMKNDHMPMPGRIILLSPWLDIALENPAIKALDNKDPFLGRESLRQAGKLYAGGTSPDHYLLSPINGPLKDLGSITVFAGSHEILSADTRKLKAMAESIGADLDYYEYADMIHGWILLHFPESQQAKQQIIDLILKMEDRNQK